MAQTESVTPKYLSRDENDPIRLAQEARAAKAEAREEMTPRQQELLWGREKMEEVLTVLRYGKRRTVHGFLTNTKTVTTSEKHAYLDEIQKCVDFLRSSVDAGREEKVSVPTPDFLNE